MYLNIEPIHYGSEQIVYGQPEVERIRARIRQSNKESITFGVLLDDTAASGQPVKRGEIDDFVRRHELRPRLLILETDLTWIAVAILWRLKRDFLRVEKRFVWHLDEPGEFVVVQRFTKGAPIPDAKCPGSYVRTQLKADSTGRHIYSLMVPTCALYIAAWYSLRLLTPLKKWLELAEASTEMTVIDHVKNVALQILDGSLEPLSHLVNFIPKAYERDEERSLRLLNKLFQNAGGTGSEEAIIENEYY